MKYKTVLVQCSLIEPIELCMTLTQTGNITQSENFYSKQNDVVVVITIANVMENMFVLRDAVLILSRKHSNIEVARKALTRSGEKYR